MGATVPAEVRRSFELAKSLRLPWEGRWTELSENAMPFRPNFSGTPTPGGEPAGAIYDETGQAGIEELANRLQSGLMPEGMEWARIQAGRVKLHPDDERQLRTVQKAMFDAIGASNFAPAMNDSLKDLAGYGNHCIKIMPAVDYATDLHFQAFPLADVWITPGPNGRWGDIHARHRIQRHLIQVQWPDANLDDTARNVRADQPCNVFEHWVRDWREAVETWRWHLTLDGKELLQSEDARGSGSCPFIFGRWSGVSGELYGIGQGMHALPAIRVANEVTRQTLVRGELENTGLWQAEDDGVLNPYAVRLVPGAIIPHAPNSQGLRPLAMPGGTTNFSRIVLEDQKHAIRKTLYNETLGKREGTPVSALEIQERMAELARQMGPSYFRVWAETVRPLVERVRFLLVDAGRIKLPAIDGHTVAVVATSPLARAAAQTGMRNIDAFIAGIARAYGPQVAAAAVPAERYVPIAAELYDVPKDLPATEEELQEKAKLAGETLGQAGDLRTEAAAVAAPMLAGIMGGGGA